MNATWGKGYNAAPATVNGTFTEVGEIHYQVVGKGTYTMTYGFDADGAEAKSTPVYWKITFPAA